MAYLRIYAGKALQEQRELTEERITIGRDMDNDIVLKNPGVSKHHAVIEKHGHYFEVVDTASANGVFVNGERIQRRRLKFWDEIQIFNHVLKFMAVPKLPGDVDRDLGKYREQIKQDETMEVDISGLGDLLKLRNQKKAASLISGMGTENERKHSLGKVNFRIGRSRRCDLRIVGWLGPATAATIQHRSNGYYIVPRRRGKVLVNKSKVAAPTKLNHGDDLQIRGTELKFYLLPVAGD